MKLQIALLGALLVVSVFGDACLDNLKKFDEVSDNVKWDKDVYTQNEAKAIETSNKIEGFMEAVLSTCAGRWEEVWFRLHLQAFEVASFNEKTVKVWPHRRTNGKWSPATGRSKEKSIFDYLSDKKGEFKRPEGCRNAIERLEGLEFDWHDRTSFKNAFLYGVTLTELQSHVLAEAMLDNARDIARDCNLPEKQVVCPRLDQLMKTREFLTKYDKTYQRTSLQKLQELLDKAKTDMKCKEYYPKEAVRIGELAEAAIGVAARQAANLAREAAKLSSEATEVAGNPAPVGLKSERVSEVLKAAKEAAETARITIEAVEKALKIIEAAKAAETTVEAKAAQTPGRKLNAFARKLLANFF